MPTLEKNEVMHLKVKKIHFIGIGGVGMSGIAEILKQLGYEVSGSDIAENYNTNRLKDMGITIYIGHQASNVNSSDLVVVSSAINDDNPEIQISKSNQELKKLVQKRRAIGKNSSYIVPNEGKVQETVSRIIHLISC